MYFHFSRCLAAYVMVEGLGTLWIAAREQRRRPQYLLVTIT